MARTETPRRGYRNYVPHGMVIGAGCCWGVSGLFNRSLAALGFPSQTVSVFRTIGAGLCMALLMLILDRKAFRIRLRHLPYFLCTGLISELIFTLCYFESQQVNSLAVAGILLYTAPAFVMLFSALIFKDKITKKHILAMLIAFAGCVLASGVLGGTVQLSGRGLLLGLASGLLYASYTIFSRLAMRHYTPQTVTLYSFMISGAGGLVMAALGMPELGGVTWGGAAAGHILATVLIATIIPYLLYTGGLRGLGDGGLACILVSVFILR